MTTPAQDRQQIDYSISYDFNYVEPPPDRLLCKICQLPCCEAHKSECCGHVFCKRDLEKMKAATSVSYACPICRVEPFKTYPDRAVDREIKGLKVYCLNKEVGCGCSWSGELDQIDAHLTKCEIACRHCKEVMHYTAMVDHVNKCPCYCQYCNTVAEKEVICGQHRENCSKYPVACPNTCGKDKIPQDEIDDHKDECPLEMVWCEYYDVGCKTTVVREEMPAHYRDAMGEHLQYMHSVVRQLQKEKEKLGNAKVVAEANILENAEQIKELSNNQTLHEEAKAKMRENITDLNEKYHKLKFNMFTGTIMLVSVLVVVFAVLVNYNEDKFTLVAEHLQTLSITSDRNQLQNDKYLHLLKENAELQNDQLKQTAKAIVEASANIETLKHYIISVIHHVVSGLKPQAIPIDTKLDILSELSRNVQLVRPIFKLSDYRRMIEQKENWTSSPFFAFDGGYQMCLKVYPAGIREGAGNHVSVELYLMKGPHDEKLQQLGYWPLKGNFSVHLLDQVRKGVPAEDSHIIHSTLISDIKNSYRVTHDGMVKIDDLSIYQFVSHVDLIEPYYMSKYTNSSVNGNLYFRVQYNEEDQATYGDISTLSVQLNIQTLSLQHSLKSLHLNRSSEEIDQITPVILKLPRFSKMVYGESWYSSPFFAFGGGYQMCLKVVRSIDCLITSQLFVMKGPYDKKLRKLGLWPLKGIFTVKLFGNDKYYARKVILDEERCTTCFQRVTKGNIATEGFGFSVFTLDSGNFCTKPNFFKDDALFFEVLYNKDTAV